MNNEQIVLKITKKQFTFLLVILLFVMIGIIGLLLYISNTQTKNNSLNNNNINTASVSMTDIQNKVIPSNGFHTGISLNDSILKLIQNGVIDKQKFLDLYSKQGGLPTELQNVLDTSSNNKILLTQKNNGIYLNLLWALGLSNYLKENESSPINGKDVNNYASTGGWTLGKESSGGGYFNKFKIVSLTQDQEKTVVRIAESIYRPCCNNSSFFQDCNHGSALYGMLQLGVSQGLSEDELYKEALAFNSFWFPNNYIQTAQYFKIVKNIDWENVDPRLILSQDYSSISGWNKNVGKVLSDKGVTPPTASAPGCSI